MTPLFQRCHAILVRESRLFHYAELTDAALCELGVHQISSSEREDKREDVREKMLLAGQYETFYTGKACGSLTGLRWWFIQPQLEINTHSSEHPVDVEVNTPISIEAATEALFRVKHMKVKNSSVSDRVRYRALARGMIIEQHITSWFRKRYPEQFLHAANHQQYERWCNHDFRVSFGGRELEIDVLGPNRQEIFAMAPDKPLAQIHLLSEDHFGIVRMRGMVFNNHLRDLAFASNIHPQRTVPVQVLLIALDCAKNKRDYCAVKAKATSY